MAVFEALAAGRLPAGLSSGPLPRLRFDRVAQRLVRDLAAATAGSVPAGAVLIVTVDAPIRLPGQTVAALGVRLRDHPAGGPIGSAFDDTVCGNRVRARMVRRAFEAAPKVIVFVCNPSPSPEALLDLAEGLVA
jgi:hypothetical protein